MSVFSLPRGHAKTSYFEAILTDYIEKESGDMSEAKRHYIADESLGGIEREYVEVDRKAEVGDYVHITSEDGMLDVSTIGRVIADEYDVDDFYADYVSGDKLSEADGGDIYVWVAMGDRYTTLYPTNIVRISGERYEMVDRRADVGEKVITVKDSYVVKKGEVFDVNAYNRGDVNTAITERSLYVTLSPLSDDDSTGGDIERLTDMLASLSQEVAQLKRKVSEISDDVEDNGNAVDAQQDAIYRLLDTTDRNAKDIRTWADDYTQNKAEVADLTEMLTDDIVTLDERTQPLTTEGVSKLSEELTEVVTEAMGVDKPVFDASNIRTFSLSDLDGKTLKIRKATDLYDGLLTTTVIGFDEDDNVYVLENKSEVIE